MQSRQARRTRLDEFFGVKTATEVEIAELLCEKERTGPFAMREPPARRPGSSSTTAWPLRGRNRRFPTDAQRREIMRRDRRCRFPNCTNVTFTNVHHIVPWEPGGRTDLPNLAIVCRHPAVVHRKGWTMSGNANEESTFVSPSGHAMTSRPSSRWTVVSSLR